MNGMKTRLVHTKSYIVNYAHPVLKRLQNQLQQIPDRQVCKEKEKNIKSGRVPADAVEVIVAYLNEKAGKHFQPSTRQTARLITARLKQGRKVEDFFQVIDTKCAQWLNDSKLSTYLRPSTLFSETNFENYLNEKPAYRERKIEPVRSIVLDFSKGEG